MSERIDLVGIAREVLGVPKAPTMEPEDIIRNLRAENQALAERLRQTPDMRQIIAELRVICHLSCRPDCELRWRLRELVRRLDVEN